MVSLEKIKSKLYTENKFGYQHQVKSPKLDQEEIDYLAKTYNITTHYKFKGDTSPTAVHPQCIACQARQLAQYYGSPKGGGDISTSFEVRCNFIRGEMPGATAMAYEFIKENPDISFDHAMKLVRMSGGDPVSWLEVMLGYDDNSKGTEDERYLRWYQKEQIRCSSRKYAIREGRRTGKTFAICNKLIHLLFTGERRAGISDGIIKLRGLDIIIITPFQAQLNMIFEELQNLIERNSALVEQVDSGSGGFLYTKTPNYSLYLKDTEGEINGRKYKKRGGSITGFVAGATNKGDGSGGGSIRGQSADWLYIDEMDMITPETFQSSIKPIKMSNPDVGIIVSSTPIGKRADFYNFCLKDPTWKADYLPSTILPHWDQEEADALNGTTEDNFQAEYMAHFPDGTFGVFKPGSVYAALDSYEYSDVGVEYNNWWRERNMFRSEMYVCLGIDWNKNAGTEYYVVGYHPDSHTWWALDAVNIPQSKFSGPAFSNELKRLNHKWQPNWIYADNGYGHHILDDLMLQAHQLQSKTPRTPEEESTAKLLERLKRIEFGGKIELRDPVSNTPLEKHAKEYLVENAKRHFEDLNEKGNTRFRFPSTDKTLISQLLNYKVEKYSAAGKPVYGMESSRIGDHRLDAMMLALAGLQIEAWHYSKNVVNTSGTPGIITESQLKERNQYFDPDQPTNTFVNIPQNPMGLGIKELIETVYYRHGNKESHERTRRISEAEEQVKNWTPAKNSRSIIYDEKSPLYYQLFELAPDSSGSSTEDWAERQLESLQRNFEKLKSQVVKTSKKFSRRITR